MRLIAVAIVLGTALGAALLGSFNPRPPHVDSAVLEGLRVGAPEVGVALPNPQQPLQAVPAHSDSNSQGNDVFLNQHVIDGQTTDICIASANRRLQYLVEKAIDLWNDGLSDLEFDVFSLSSSCVGAHIEVVASPLIVQGRRQVHPCGSFDAVRGGVWACVDPVFSNTDNLPRMSFRSQFDPSRGRALLVYQALVYQPNNAVHEYVMAHELGHLLGLAHYEDQTNKPNPHLSTGQLGQTRCNALRQTIPARFDVDPQDDDYTTLTGPDVMDCASHRFVTQGYITGRDRRDFYEAYQVGAITNVRPSLTVTTLPGSIAPSKFVYLRWADADAREAGHNAKYISVVGRNAALAAGVHWKELKTIRIRNPEGQLMVSLMLDDEELLDRTEHKIVGLTRGGLEFQHNIRGLPRPSTPTAERWALLLPKNPTRTSSFLGSDRWVMGDPTHVFGDIWKATSPQLYLTTSVSPNACYVSGVGAAAALPAVWAAGSSTEDAFSPAVKLRVEINNAEVFDRVSASANGTYSIACNTISRTGLIDVRIPVSAATTLGNSRNQTKSGFVYIQDRNHDMPLRVLSVSVQQEDGFVVTPGSDAHADTVAVNCSRRMPGVFRWNVVGGVEPIAVWLTPVERWMPSSLWASGYTGNTVTIRCPTQGRTRAELGVFALGADGSGVAARAGDFQIVAEGAPEPPTNVRVLSTTQRRLRVAWDRVAGATAYQASVRVEGAKSVTTDGNTTSAWVWAPHAGTEYVAQVRARDARGVWSAWTPALGTSQAPSLAPPPDVWVSETTSDSITVTWDTITGIPFYGVWCCDMMMPVNEPGFLWLPAGTTLAQSHTFEGLATDKEYTVSVRSRSGFDNTSPWVVLDPVCIGSCDDD